MFVASLALRLDIQTFHLTCDTFLLIYDFVICQAVINLQKNPTSRKFDLPVKQKQVENCQTWAQ